MSSFARLGKHFKLAANNARRASVLDCARPLQPEYTCVLRWPEPIYMRVGYVFESRFSAYLLKLEKNLF